MSQPRGRIFYGWWIVLATWSMALYGSGVFFYGFSVFFKPIVTEFGWSRAATSGAFALSQAEGFLEGPIIGPLVDRFGPRVLILIGVIMVSAGFIVLSFVHTLPAFYLVYLILLAVGFNTGFFVAPQAAVGNWFVRRRSRALGLMTTAFGFGGAVMVPVVAWLVGSFGWRSATMILGAGMLVICLPMALIVRHRPEQYGYLPDGGPATVAEPSGVSEQETSAGQVKAGEEVTEGIPGEVDFTLREALRTSAFWLLSGSFGLRTLAISATVVHQIPFLTDQGFSGTAAAGVLALMALMSVPGRVIFGFLGDYLNKRQLVFAAYLLQAAGLAILLTATSLEQLYLFTVVFGLGWGAPTVLVALRGDYFGRRYFATIAGVQQSIIAVGTMAGPVYAGWIFDTTGSYEIAFVTFIIAILLGAVLALFARPPKLPARLQGSRVGASPSGVEATPSDGTLHPH